MADIVWRNDVRRLGDLVPWEHNPKRMGKKAGEGLHISLEKFGYALPMLVSPNSDLYDGHQRLPLLKKMLKEYGPDATVDVRVSSRPLTDDERRELVIRLKQNQAGWDFDMLPNLYEKEELVEWGFELEELGMFEEGGGSADAEPQVDRAEELRQKWGVEPGQLWAVGKHRLICGDCTDAEVVKRVMGGEKAQLCFTDPPYGANIAYATIDDSQDALVDLIGGFFALAEQHAEVIALTPGVANMWHYKRPDWVLCWYYGVGTGRTPWGFTSWQPVIVFGEDPKLSSGEGCHPDAFQFMQTQDDMKERRELSHVVPKPLSVWKRFLERLTNKHTKIVYEPFSGSGTTMVACEQLGRRCRAVEIAPGYVAVALERMATAFPGIVIERVE